MSTDRWLALSGMFNSDCSTARDQLNKLISFAEDEAVELGLLSLEEAKRHAANLGKTQLNPMSGQVQNSIKVLSELYDECHPLEMAG